MTVKIVLGGQFGDEGKGKIVDYLADDADIIARATGGNNAGHTVIVGDKEYKFHLLPSGIIHKDKLNICGNGMVIDPKVIVSEIETMEKNGYTITDKQLVISSNAHIIQEKHIKVDLEKGGKIGTTGRGIGPCYEDKVGRRGLRMLEYEGEHASKLKQFVKDGYLVINEAINAGKNILVEGAQGTMLDIDHGTYPFVTSSNPVAGGVCVGLGFGPTKVDEVNGILKAYITRVGEGPLPTELGTDDQPKQEGTWDKIKPDFDKHVKEALERFDDEYFQGKYLRLIGKEYGTTTGRPRRTGWFDAVLGRYSVMVNGLTSIIVTKLDVLQMVKEIKVCVAYEIDGKRYDNYPIDLELVKKAKPIYEVMPGWMEDITDCKKPDDLPNKALEYLRYLEKILNVKISLVSVGPDRGQTIKMR